MSSARELVREVRIDALPEDVFPYFTVAEKMVAWKAVDAELDARPGGEFRVDVTGDGDVARGKFLEIDPPRRVVFTWGWERPDAAFGVGTTVVEVTLAPDGDGTLLRLVHRGLPERAEQRSAEGWEHYLQRLAVAASGRDPGRDPWAAPIDQRMDRDTRPTEV